MARKKDEDAMTSKVTVVAKQEKGRMRAGFRFTMEPTAVEATEEQIRMIEADPYLAIVPASREDKAAAQ